MEPRGLGYRLGGFVTVVVVLVSALVINVSGNLVFPVSHKFNGRHGASLSELKAHDHRRHARFLGATQNAVDMVLGGSTEQTGLYFTKLGIGNPSHDYYLQIDTGSNLFWVSCAECGKGCPDRSELTGVKLTLYDRNSSSTSKVVSCGDNFCTSPSVKSISDCKPDEKCNYHLQYVGKDKTSGYYVKDDVQFQKASGNFQTSSTSGSVIFGCGTEQSGSINNPNGALSGVIGFDQDNITMLSQLAAAGRVRNKFAHCLDNTKQLQGGGIWAIGEVVEPKMMHTSPIVPNQTRYNIVVEKIEVGSDAIELPTSGGGVLDETSDSNSDQIIAFFDSGTTFAHLPPKLREPIVKKIFATEPGLKFLKDNDGEYSCFKYSKNIDEKFPIVKFTFKNSASLWVYPHDYLYETEEGAWCHGWMKMIGEDPDIILGDMTLSNKLVVYDLENQVLGWTDHNCSSSIKVKDDKSGSDYSVQYHNLSSSDASSPRLLMSFVLLVTAAAAMLQMISI
ncbi:aspartic proteinase 36-like [Rosa rugosa]|uniref:aspartic proteinase 36-like n=1 Tax=Rosa rugosa TaxID=74645 RepID=UPI002B4052E6|nr:aspartic proteinase 36-like [Rosa rugosa]